VRDLRLNQIGSIGSPRPILEYWLCDGNPPRGTVLGIRTTPIDLATLRAEHLQGQWCVRDAYRTLCNFGPRQDEAQQAVAVLKRFGFTQVAYLGRPATTMMVFLAGSDFIRPTALRTPDLKPQPIPRENPSPKTRAMQPPAPGSAPGGLKPTQEGAAEAVSYGRQLASPLLGFADGATERVPFEWRQALVRKEGREWLLVSGTYTIARFENEHDARRALTAVQFYRLSEHCRIGHPTPVFNYFLSGGQAPRGSMLGLQRVSIRPTVLEVRKFDRDWALCEGDRPLYWFGEFEQDARQALKDVQRYQFDTVCRVGTSDFVFLIRGR
jgi:hypothetical protein